VIMSVRYTATERAELAGQLHALADAIAAGSESVPAMHRLDADGVRLRVVPPVVHDVLCAWRVASPQDTVPVVLACAGCGLSYQPSSIPEE